MWSWRQNYVGRLGELLLLESERKSPGKTFMYFSGAEWSEERQDHDDWYLRTGYGELSVDGNVLIFRTQNSAYTFELTDWRAKRDALVAEYLQRSGGDLRSAYDAISETIDAMDSAIALEALLPYLEARTVLLKEVEP